MSHGEGGLVIQCIRHISPRLLLMTGEQFPDFIIMYFCRLNQCELNYKYWWSDRHLGTTARTSRRYIYSVTVVVDSSRCCDLCVICTFQDLLTLHYYNGQFTSIGACHNSRYCEFICQHSSGTLNRGWPQDTIHVIIPTMQWSFSGLNQIVYYRCSDHHNNKRDGITQDVKERSAGGGLDGLW